MKKSLKQSCKSSLISEPDFPTTPTISPVFTLKLILFKTKADSSLYLKDTLSKTISPFYF